ncbi:MAG: DUF2478 domain-containing protein [Rhizobiales bacterium]|nr:DUF2478 domain-containing protein [Hyphomicrobiales bacterium]
MRMGLWPAFLAAIATGKPLLTTVSPKHFEAWKAFAPAACWLDANVLAIEQWRRAATSQPSMANPAYRS